MRKQILFMAVIAVAALFSCKNKSEAVSGEVITDGLRFCESTLPYNGGVLIANFGTEELNPLNNEGKGYIVYNKDGVSSVKIAADGNMCAPKGMALDSDRLFVCDVNKLLVYELGDTSRLLQEIKFPEGNLFVNDALIHGNDLYVSVTNTDKIFKLDISSPDSVGEPIEWMEVAGPNGLMLAGDTMYIASYPADGATTPANVVYVVSDLEAPVAEPLFEIAGQYDGIALAPDKQHIYLTNWQPAQVCRVSLADQTITPVPLDCGDTPLIGPADISIDGQTIYIPDLPNSRVFKLKAE